MKSSNKNKPTSLKKYLKQGQSPTKQSHRYRPRQPHPQYTSQQFLDQMIEFHLTDEQPQSLMAKRKLQEFSIRLDEEVGVSAFKRNQNSINMQRVSKNKDEPSEGWVEDQLRATNKSQPDSNNKQKRSQSASQCTIRQTLKTRTQQEQKKFSFTSKPLQNNKLNLSFNNLSPFHMQTIPQTEISKQLVKKVKSHSSRRPITALYYGASQKVLTIFEKQLSTSTTKRNHPSETMRIHSNKQVDPKVLGWRDNKFLKTFSFNAINNNNKSVSRSKRGSQKIQSNNGGGQNESSQKQNSKKGSSQVRKQGQNHMRTYSEAYEQQGSKDGGQKQGYGSYSQRKMTALSQKRHILSKRIKSHENMPLLSQENNNQKQMIRESFSRQSNLIGGRKPVTPHKIQPNYDITLTNPTNHQQPSPQSIKPPSPTKPIPPPSPLQHDFSLLLSLLKHQSQNIFGGQLHTYLTQMKNNSLYNYYYSGMGNRKKNGKLVLNTSKGRGGRRGKGESEHERMRGLIEEKKGEGRRLEGMCEGVEGGRDEMGQGREGFVRVGVGRVGMCEDQ